jgi:hypothetical protein
MNNMDNEKLTELFEEFLVIFKLVNRKSIADILKAELNTAQLIEMYQMTDGTKSTRDIASSLKSKCSHGTVANTWSKWALVGIVVPSDRKGRVKAAFDLEEYGILHISDNE